MAKLWNSLKPSEKLDLLISINISADNVDIGEYEGQYPSFKKALKEKSNLIKDWKRKNKKQISKTPIKENERVLTTGTYTIL